MANHKLQSMDNRFRLYQQTEEAPVSGMKQNCGCVVEDDGCPVRPRQTWRTHPSLVKYSRLLLLAPALLMSHTSPRCSTALWCSATIPPDLVKIRTPKLQLECFGDNEWDLNQFPSREFEYFCKASKLKQLSVGGWWQGGGEVWPRYGPVWMYSKIAEMD